MSETKPDLSTSPRTIWRLTWPQMLMMYLFFFTGLTSIWAAGQLSPDVQASIGMVTQCTMFLMVIVMAVCSGATAAISQSIGMGRIMRARLYISTTVYGSLILGAVMAVPAWCLGDPILLLIQTPEELLPMARQIWRIALLGLPLQYVFNATGVLFRSVRLVFPPLCVAALVCVANLVLSLGFGLGWFGLPSYGFIGLIWANVGTQALGAVANCVLLVHSGYFSFSRIPRLKWLKGALPYLARVALPAGLAQIVWQSGYLTLFMLVASVPNDPVHALAGLTAGLRAEALIFMPSMAFNMTCSVLVGNSLGENKVAQARRIGLQMTFLGVSIMTLMAMCVWPFREHIAAFLSQDALTRTQIVAYLSYNLVSTPFSIASQIMGGIMVGAGATAYNLLIYGGTFWVVRIPLGWWLGHRVWGTASGVFLAMVISQVIQSALMFYVVCKKDWARFAMKRTARASAATPRHHG